VNRDDLRVLHLQHVVWERVLWKQLWYQMCEVVRWNRVRANYAGTINEEGCILRYTPLDWVRGYDLSMLDLDIEPWQKKECEHMLSTYGKEVFAGAGVDFFELM
jgi:hypothetical protein